MDNSADMQMNLYVTKDMNPKFFLIYTKTGLLTANCMKLAMVSLSMAHI
jgi:hypothetical protein